MTTQNEDQQFSKPPRTVSADSGYFSQGGYPQSEIDVSGNRCTVSIEEAEQFLASLGDAQGNTTVLSNAISNTPEGTAEPETPASSSNVSNENETLVGEMEKSAYESMIWEGTFDVSMTGKKRSRESSSDSKRAGSVRQRIVRKNEQETMVSPRVRNLEIIGAKSDVTIFGAMPGLTRTGIIAVEIDVNEEAVQEAKNWAQRREKYDPDNRCLRVLMCCYAKSICQWMNQDEEDMIAKLTTNYSTLSMNANAWPSLPPTCVKLGDTSWSMFELSKRTGPIDVTNCIKSGLNDLQIAHLDDASEFVFILCAEKPSALERTTAMLEYLRAQRKKAIRDFLLSHSSNV